MKVGVKVGSCTTFSVESPFISGDFYAIRPLIVWAYVGSIFIANMGGGVVKIVFRCAQMNAGF